jgi:homocysteine S-methyltransferase
MMGSRGDSRSSATPSGFLQALNEAPALLTEGSIYERLRRLDGVHFDPILAHAATVFDPPSREVLERIHREYIEIGIAHQLPMVTLTDTWRANRERIESSAYARENVNGECVRLMTDLRRELSTVMTPVFVGGMLGPRGDAYAPEQALTAHEAESFHSYQVEKLAPTGLDFLKAATLPSTEEATGLAQAMSAASLPYFISFVIRPDGKVLDGTPLDQAFDRIDQTLTTPPDGYYVNCVHPEILLTALETLASRLTIPNSLHRLVGFHANTSARSPEELAVLEEIETEDPRRYAAKVREVHEIHGVKILGGCCGSGPEHLEWIARELRASMEDG